MQTSTFDEVPTAVRQAYGAIATERQSGCCGTNLGRGGGNPQAIAALRPGERVLDVGSGGGFDVFLAARRVGPTGSVIGVDVTPELIDRARTNLGRTDVTHVDFRLGSIEHLPVEGASVDVIMSSCAINLSPDKAAMFHEAFRVLAPGGRLAISDIVAIGDLPAAIAIAPAACTGCTPGAVPVGTLERVIPEASFTNVRIGVQSASRAVAEGWMPGSAAAEVVASALIEAVKPEAAC